MPDAPNVPTCPKCGDPLLHGKCFCPNCGLAVAPLTDRATIDAYIQAKISQELTSRLKDQASLVREIGNQAEDVVWARLKRYTWILSIAFAIIGLILTLYGVKSLDDAKQKVVSAAKEQVEPSIRQLETNISNLEARAAGANTTISTVESNLKTAQQKITQYDDKISNAGKAALADITQLRSSLDNQEQQLANQGQQIAHLEGQVVNLGNRDLLAHTIRTTGDGPSYWAVGTLGCPTPETLAKDQAPVAICVQGTPPTLELRTSSDVIPVSGRSQTGFQDQSTGTKPSCTSAIRGTFFVEKGTGGMGDRPFVCVKSQNNTYEWHHLDIN
jgi:uncharacterized Zn finger protein (UPF0148 family)